MLTPKGTPILKPVEQQMKEARKALQQVLAGAVLRGRDLLRVNATAFVSMGVGEWATQMHAVSPEATCDFLRALADICDTTKTPEEKKAAGVARAAAVETILRDVAQVEKAMQNPRPN